MGRCRIVPYEGKEPYAFVSYAHKDSDAVYPIIEELDKRGYRIWYDDGIAPGSEWPENIAEHLAACSIVIAFITPASIDSANCRRELTYALSKRKNFLAIVLEPTEMSPGMEMQLSAQQSVLKYNYTDDESFYKKVVSCDDLQVCLKDTTEETSSHSAAIIEQPVVPASTEEVVAEQTTSVSEEKDTGESKEKKPINRKKIGIIATCLAGIIALFVVIAFLRSDENKKGVSVEKTETIIEITDGVSVKKTDRTLTLRGETISSEAVKNINKLKKLERITFEDCEFEGDAITLLELPATIYNVKIKNCSGVKSLYFLWDLENISYLNLSGSGITDDMLEGMSFPTLSNVDISFNEGISDLSVFKDSYGLESICFDNTSVSDISALCGKTVLSTISGSYSLVTDITCLGTEEQLQSIAFKGCFIEKFPEKFCALRLKEIFLDDTPLSTYEMFSNCTILERVGLSGTFVTDVSALEKSADTLIELNLGNLSLEADNVKFLSKCKKLELVTLDGINLENLDILSEATQLKYISAWKCGLKNIDGLKNCVNLIHISIPFNEISSLAGLSNLSSENIDVLNISHNPITSLEELPDGIRYKNLQVINEGFDYSTISAESIKYLYGYYSPTLLTCDLCQTGTILIVLDCPEDKKVSLEDAWICGYAGSEPMVQYENSENFNQYS